MTIINELETLRAQLIKSLNPTQRAYLADVEAGIKARVAKLRTAVSPAHASLAVAMGGAIQDVIVGASVAGLSSAEIATVLETMLEQQRESAAHNLMLAALDDVAGPGKVAAA